MTAPATVAVPNITLDRRAPSRHDSTVVSQQMCLLQLYQVQVRHREERLILCLSSHQSYIMWNCSNPVSASHFVATQHPEATRGGPTGFF
jgi:hypothetical protein